jgi:hypothetical protein
MLYNEFVIILNKEGESMKKTTYVLVATAVFMAVFASACGMAQPAVPTAVPIPTQIPPVAPPPVEVPTQQIIIPTATQAFAPVCQNTASSCAAPDLHDTEAIGTYCVKKIPYQNILVDEGVTFESLNPNTLTCMDNGAMAEGKHVIECHGTPLWTTELKLTNTACGGSTLVTGTGQCQEGFGYDTAQGCCAPLTGDTGGSVTIKINMGACP